MNIYHFSITNSYAPDGSLFDYIEAETRAEAYQKMNEKYWDAEDIYCMTHEQD